MNITFLIGNGFDLNLGLKTGFDSFLEYYLQQPNTIAGSNELDEDIKSFKELISKDIEYWSDLEFALGQMTIEKPLNTVDGVVKCKRDIDRHLREYLIMQDEKLDFSNDVEYKEETRRSIVDYSRYMKPQTQKRIERLQDSLRSSQRVYNAITFNYTSAFDSCFSSLPELMESKVPSEKKNSHKRGELIHIHGSIRQSMIVGVNDATQIANKELASNKIVQRYMIKPRMNEQSQELREEDAKRVLNATSVFVVFGMAIGETDKKWWNMIGSRLAAYRDAQLIMINYKGNLNNAFIYDVVDEEVKLIDKFLKVSGQNEVVQEQIRPRISAFFNTDMFKMKLQQKVSETELLKVIDTKLA